MQREDGFIKRHRKKSVLALLLLLRANKAVMLLAGFLGVAVATGLFMPGHVWLDVPGVKQLLSAFGVYVQPDEYATTAEMLKAAMDRAYYEGRDKWLLTGAAGQPGSGVGARGAAVGSKSSIEMLKKILAGRYKGKDKVPTVNEPQPGETGKKGAAISMEELIANGFLPGGAGGGPGGAAGGTFADWFGTGYNYGGGSNDGIKAKPYLDNNWSAAADPTILDKKSGLVANATTRFTGDIPVARAISRSPVSYGSMGRFNWRDANTSLKGARSFSFGKADDAMTQAAIAATATGAGDQAKDSSIELASAYTGYPYDGNDTSGLNMSAAAASSVPGMPSSSMPAITLPDISGLQGMLDSMQECLDAQASDSSTIGKTNYEMDEIGKTMTNPPADCCDSGIDEWNDKCDTLYEKCEQLDKGGKDLQESCGASLAPLDAEPTAEVEVSSQATCQNYLDMKIDKCNDMECLINMLLGWILIVLGIVMGGWWIFVLTITGVIIVSFDIKLFN